eukprot:1161579-Pelagomonas_calceolata.AAC.1
MLNNVFWSAAVRQSAECATGFKCPFPVDTAQGLLVGAFTAYEHPVLNKVFWSAAVRQSVEYATGSKRPFPVDTAQGLLMPPSQSMNIPCSTSFGQLQ